MGTGGAPECGGGRRRDERTAWREGAAGEGVADE